jgi:hypothetical protein
MGAVATPRGDVGNRLHRQCVEGGKARSATNLFFSSYGGRGVGLYFIAIRQCTPTPACNEVVVAASEEGLRMPQTHHIGVIHLPY